MTFLTVAVFSLCLANPAAEVQTLFHQVHPEQPEPTAFQRSPGQQRAIVLIHGFQHQFREARVFAAALRDWQEPGSLLVQTLGKEGDVFAFAYGTNVPVEQIAGQRGLREGIRRLKQLGYGEVVLVGYSAGGLVARQFVEDYPDAGVTKLIQVCAPNAGTALAEFPIVLSSQKAFLHSLTEKARAEFLRQRAEKVLPAAVQCVCVIGTGAGGGDGVIANCCQWPADLQHQGIPVVKLEVLHFQVVLCRQCAARLADLVRSEHPRWSQREVGEALRSLRPGGVLLER